MGCVAKKLIYYLSMVFVGVAVIFLLFIVFNVPKCDLVESLYTDVEVVNGLYSSMGFNVNKDNISFGKISTDVMSEKRVQLNYSKDAEVSVRIEGDVAPWVFINRSNFDITANKISVVRFQLNVPLSTPGGFYDGRVYFCYSDK